MLKFCIASIISVALIPSTGFSQSLTEIKTIKQIEKYIKENLKYKIYNYDSFAVKNSNTSFDNFKEGDFNHDEIKDFLIFGTAHVTVNNKSYHMDEIVVLLGDKNKPKKVEFPYGYFRSLMKDIVPYPQSINIDEKDFVKLKYEVRNYDNKTSQIFYDTFYIVNNHIMPYAVNPDDKKIKLIEFKTSLCLGSCPVFKISINDALDAEYDGIKYVKKMGEYRGKFENTDWEYLTQLLNNLRFENLETNYRVPWTDDQTGFLNVYYKKGRKKNITDYGLAGSFGLSVLYAYLFELKDFD